MKSKSTGSKASTTAPAIADEINAYSKAQSIGLSAICDALRAEIDSCLPSATSKMWHGSPVWFIGDNPVVGYNVTTKKVVCLLFWNGQSFDENGFIPVGKSGKAAQVSYANQSEIDTTLLHRWLMKAGTMIWDYRSMYKERLAETKAAKADATRPRKKA